MKSTFLVRIGLCLGALMMLGPTAFASVSTTTPAGHADQSATRLLQDIRADATQVRSEAVKLDALTADPNTTWADLDRKWNEMAPSLEDMQVNLYRLEDMQTVISSAERNDLDQSKALIRGISARLNEFRALLDKPGVQINNAGFRTYAESLRSEAGKLDRVTSAS